MIAPFKCEEKKLNRVTPMAITALGMVCPVGHDVKTACASIRAGIKINADLPFEVFDTESFEMQPIAGFPIENLFEGYQGVAILAKLAAKSLEDLMDYGSLSGQDELFWQQTGLLLCYSASRDEAADIVDEQIKDQLASLVVAQANFPIQHSSIGLLDQGNSGPLIALAKAQRHIQQRSLKRVIIVGIDSLVDEATVKQLADCGRLKTPEAPQGLMPGEASAAFMVEEANTAQQRSARIVGYVVGCDYQLGPSFLDEKPRYGHALSDAMVNAIIQNSAAHGECVSTIYGDLNGEFARSMDWGNALVRLEAKLGYVPDQYLFPTEFIGDTGAASSAVSICVASRAFERHYSQGNLQLVTAISENGSVAAALLAKKLL